MKSAFKVVGIIAISFSAIRSCGAVNSYFIPLNIGLDFVQPFGDNDILRGFKTHVNGGEGNFKAKPFTGTIKTRPFPTEYAKTYFYETERDIQESFELSGSVSASFGPIKGDGAVSYVESKIRSKYQAEVTYTRRSAAYTRFVDLETIQDSPILTAVCQGLCEDSDSDDISDEFGTKFVDQVVYGSQLDFVFKVTSKYELDEDTFKAHITGKVLGIEKTKRWDKGGSSSSSDFDVTVEANAVGVHFPIPKNPTLDEVHELIEKFSTEYEEVLFSLSSYETLDDESNVLKMLAPVGFTVLSISDHLSALNVDEVEILDRKMEQLGDALLDLNYRRAKLLRVMEEEKSLRSIDPHYRVQRFEPYEEEVDKVLAVLDGLIKDCKDYRAKSLRYILDNDPPPGIGAQDSTFQKTYYGLIGMAYIAPPLEIYHTLSGTVSTYQHLYYTGFALPVPNPQGFKLTPYFSGVVFEDATDDVVTRGNTTNDIYDKLSAIISPSGLPPTNIGYTTPFVMSLPSYMDEETDEEIAGVFYTTAYDEDEEILYPMTHYGGIFFCDDSPTSAQLQMAHKPEDLYDVNGREKTQFDCVKYGDVVYLAIAFLGSGDIFLKVEDDETPTWALLEFANPLAEGANMAAFQWKVQSAIPFSGNVLLEDPLIGECVPTGDLSVYNVIFQNMEYENRWLTGGRDEEGEDIYRNKTRAVSVFSEEKPAEAVLAGYKWQLGNYEKARTDMMCVDLEDYEDE